MTFGELLYFTGPYFFSWRVGQSSLIDKVAVRIGENSDEHLVGRPAQSRGVTRGQYPNSCFPNGPERAS